MPAPARLMASHILRLDLTRRASFGDAERHLTRAVQLEPGMIAYMVDLADLYGRNGKPGERDRVLAAIKSARDRHPMDAALRDQCVRRWAN